jgi:hypothetical protein
MLDNCVPGVGLGMLSKTSGVHPAQLFVSQDPSPGLVCIMWIMTAQYPWMVENHTDTFLLVLQTDVTFWKLNPGSWIH